MSIVQSRGRAQALGSLFVTALVFVLQACGDDHENPGSAVAAACGSSCNATAGQCNLPVVTAQNCAVLCDLGYSVAPACADHYRAYVDCAGASPLIACSGSSVSVDVSIPPCLDELGSYLSCAATNIQLCLDLPLDDGACVQAKMGPHARACVGTATGCTLLTGAVVANTTQAGPSGGTGAGVFCCP
ncbi:MAG TPA: hypothetical protein VH062_31555 [Polyangiaceae bacterium]|jgi:hypothetical protein|nr:hypothetical protein [Polyangiaceae bacterium]